SSEAWTSSACASSVVNSLWIVHRVLRRLAISSASPGCEAGASNTTCRRSGEAPRWVSTQTWLQMRCSRTISSEDSSLSPSIGKGVWIHGRSSREMNMPSARPCTLILTSCALPSIAPPACHGQPPLLGPRVSPGRRASRVRWIGLPNASLQVTYAAARSGHQRQKACSDGRSGQELLGEDPLLGVVRRIEQQGHGGLVG